MTKILCVKMCVIQLAKVVLGKLTGLHAYIRKEG